MAISLISGLNSIQYVDVDALLPNPGNTLSKDIEFDGVVNALKCQKFMTSETIQTQIKTNYIVSGGDTLTATLIDEDNVQTNLSVSLVADFTDELNDKITAFYQFDVVGQSEGAYRIEIKGVFDGDTKYKQSEPFQLVQGGTRFRNTLDDKFSYEYILNHYKIIARNNENQNFNYWGGDFEVIVWVEGVNGKPQSGGEVEVYDNLGNLSKLESIDQHIYELKTADIPQYLILKIQSLFGLDFITMNDKEYVTEDNGEAEYFGNYTPGVLTINLTQAFVVGINSDDQGFAVPTNEDMDLAKILQLNNASGTGDFDVTAGYSLHQVNVVLKSGTSIFLKLGTTPGGDEILDEWELSTLGELITFDIGFMGDFDNTWKIYWSLVGVGASAGLAMTTIVAKQQ